MNPPTSSNSPTGPLPVEQSCFWFASSEDRPAPALAAPQTADVAIIGAGFTGLWTALFLKELEPEKEIVVLEGRRAAYGASGRNGGIVSETIDHSYPLTIAHFGRDEARRLVRVGQENFAGLERFIRERRVDCHYERSGRLNVALNDRQLADCRATVEAAESLGVAGYQLRSAEATRAEIDSPLYRGSVYSPAGAILDPVRLAAGLKTAALQRGVNCFEFTPVRAVRFSNHRATLETPGGNVEAARVVAATNAYSHHLFPQLLPRYIPLYDYILVSDPLTPAQRSRIGWKNRQGVTDGRAFFNYYRLTSDQRILWGTSEAVYYPGNRVDETCDHSPAHYASLRAGFARHFPSLADLDFPFAWGGPICSTTRLTPFFGSEHDGRLLYGLGYTGHGIASTHLAGRILAHLAAQKPSDLLNLELVRKKPFPYPPEPVRRFAVSAVSRALRRADEGHRPSLLLRLLDALGLGFSS